MKFVCPLIVAVGLVTCSESVKLKKSARTVEFVNQEYIGKHGGNCRQIGEFQVEAIPAEVSGENGMTVLEVKARNKAIEKDATHLLQWPSKEWHCAKDGTPDPENERTCYAQAVTAYQCLIGRGT